MIGHFSPTNFKTDHSGAFAQVLVCFKVVGFGLANH